MNNYDFGILSPLRFERLVRDLLNQKYGSFESFAEGKDGGIDFRYSHAKKKILIVQCKKYKSADSLLNALKREVKAYEDIDNKTIDQMMKDLKPSSNKSSPSKE